MLEVVLKPFFKSKKFWYMVVGAVMNIVAPTLGLDPDQTKQITELLVALIVGQGLADAWKGFTPLIPQLVAALLKLLESRTPKE